MHFLQRLERLPTHHVDYALALYRNSGLVRFILGHAQVPDGVDRVALAVEDRPGTPHIIVARDGGFVTCLGENMSLRDLPIISRQQVQRLSERYEHLRDAIERVSDRGEVARLYGRMLRNGRALSREDFQSLAAIVPLVEIGFIETIGEMSELAVGYQLRYRRSHYRRLTKSKSGEGELYAFWTTWWALGHMIALLGTRGRALADYKNYLKLPSKPLLPHVLSQTAMQSAISPIMLRGAWTAARAGRKVVAQSKTMLQDARTFMGVITGALPLVAIALRHRSARGEVQKSLTRARRRIDTSMCDGLDAHRARVLLEAWPALLEPEAVDESRILQRAIGIRMVQYWSDRLPDGHPARFDHEDDIPEDLAMLMPMTMHSDLFHNEAMLVCMSTILPWLAGADASDFYMPECWLDAYTQPWNPREPLAHLEAFCNYYALRPIVRDGPKPGRNQPCPCGSGKKYKRCCIDKP